MATTAKRASAKKTSTAKTAAKKTSGRRRPNGGNGGSTLDGLRVRMYRVGFGDFFLVTVPTADGPRHILIDCGVHAGNIKSMSDCVLDLVRVTGRKLALVIVTHYHADHLSGFATKYDEFAQFEVEAVWITNRLDPDDGQAMKIKTQIAALASHLKLQLQLSARTDLEAEQAAAKADNALGVAGGSNEKAMDLVRQGFRNKPPVYYYEAGDTPTLPASLGGAITARILGPAPKRLAGDFSASDNKTEQYLAAVERRGLPDTQIFQPFEREWPASAADYPEEAFRPWEAPVDMEKSLIALQPDALAAAAATIDGTLNNQSLVVLFTCQGKNLLFVGDAQWGNWAYWLYGTPVKGKDPGISDEARDLLASIDFYKVGHHGSTNATPIPAVGALRLKCVGMCSTQTGCYGNVAKKTEVPRIALMQALEERTKQQLVRSDWIKVGATPASPEARQQLPRLPENFEVGDIYVDYVFPR